MRKFFFSFATITIVTGLALGSATADQGSSEANRKLVEAVQAWSKARELESDPVANADERLLLIDEALSRLKSIVDEYPESDLAVQLVIGNEVGPLSIPLAEAALAEAQQYAGCYSGVPTLDCFLKEALRSAREIDSPEGRADSLAKVGALARGSEIFYEAIAASSSINDSVIRVSAINKIAEFQAEAGLFSEAVETSKLLSNHAIRIALLAKIAGLKKDSELFDVAIDQVRKAPLGIAHNQNLMRAIVREQSKAGMLEQANITTVYIEDRLYKVWSLLDLYEFGKNVDHLAYAIRLARQGPLDIDLIGAWDEAEAARELARKGRIDEALEIIEKMEDRDWHDPAYRATAYALAEEGQLSEALEIADKIKEEADRYRTLASIVKHLSASDNPDAAREVVERIPDAKARSQALSHIALALYAQGSRDEALGLARSLEFPDHRAAVLIEIASKEEAEELLSDARAYVDLIEDTWSKAEAMGKLARLQRSIELYKEALRIAEGLPKHEADRLIAFMIEDESNPEILELLVSSRENGGYRGYYYGNLAEAYRGVNDLDNALRAAFKMEDGVRKVEIIRKIVRSGALSRENQAIIDQLLMDVFNGYREIENPYARASGLLRWAAVVSDCEVRSGWCKGYH